MSRNGSGAWRVILFVLVLGVCGVQARSAGPPGWSPSGGGTPRDADGRPAARRQRAVYAVGPGQAYASIAAVPLDALQPGDTVLIYYRPTPYREKWVIGGQGTAEAPITFRGVAGAGGELPVIDGENAATPLQLDYWNEVRSVIKIGGSSVPDDVTPTHVIIENLDIRGARPPATFTDDGGTVQAYALNAAAIHIERGEYITVRNCILRDSGNGLFVSSSDEEASRHVLIEGNYIHSNGNVGRIYEHNTYTAAIDITYQFNRFGPLVAGAGGNNLKDRSAQLVVRYNWIEAGNRQLDLVDAEDSVLIQQHPDYHRTFVYGNVLIEPEAAGNRQIVHYGGDSGQLAIYRKGLLYFYHNTVVSTRTDRTTLFRLSSMDEHCDARNNIFYTAHAGADLGVLDATGVIDLSHNWIMAGWQPYFGSYEGIVNADGTQIEGTDPGFADLGGQDFRPTADSACVDAAGPLHPDALPLHVVEYQYEPHGAGVARPVLGDAADIGAFEGPPRLPFDFDRDGDVDLDDLAAILECCSGPGQPPAPAPPITASECLATADDDADGDVDLLDLAAFQTVFGG